MDELFGCSWPSAWARALGLELIQFAPFVRGRDSNLAARLSRSIAFFARRPGPKERPPPHPPLAGESGDTRTRSQVPAEVYRRPRRVEALGTPPPTTTTTVGCQRPDRARSIRAQ